MLTGFITLAICAAATALVVPDIDLTSVQATITTDIISQATEVATLQSQQTLNLAHKAEALLNGNRDVQDETGVAKEITSLFGRTIPAFLESSSSNEGTLLGECHTELKESQDTVKILIVFTSIGWATLALLFGAWIFTSCKKHGW